MSLNTKLVNNALATATLNLDTIVADTITGGPTLPMAQVATGTLSAKLVLDAETDTIQVQGVWQVSADASTWVTCLPANGAALVTLATGTAGADASVTVVLPANDAVYGWKYARIAVRNTVATGAATDTYQLAYNYARI